MAKSNSNCNKPRKKKPIRFDTMDFAKSRKCALTPEKVAAIIGISRASLNALRTGKADQQDWYHLSECAGIALDLSRIGICSDDASMKLFMAMYLACGEIAKRFNSIGRLVATGPELNDLADGLDHHELQIGYASADEMTRACSARKAHIMNAKAGKLELITLRHEQHEEAGEVAA